METTGYIALSHQMIMRREMDMVANNMANLNTTGFKSESLLFVEHLEKTPDGKTLSFARDVATVRDLSPGELSVTNNPLDFAIDGEGYFQVSTPDGERFTRAGNFTLDDLGRIVTPAGDPLLSDAGAEIIIPLNDGDITVAEDGTLSTDSGQIAKVGVFGFENEQRLTKVEGQLFDPGEERPELLVDGKVEQGMIEGSNVKGVVEVTRMIDTARSYEMANRLVEDENRRIRQMIEGIIQA